MAHRSTSREQWRERVRRWEASGLSAAAYGRQHGIAPGTLGWWRWKLRSEKQAARRRRPRIPSFVELPGLAAGASAAAGSRLELALGDVTLRFPADVDDQALTRVIGVLRSAR